MGIRTTVILNLKGGVAKTTTVINLAAILANDHNKRVLVIDADSQCNTTEFFGADPDSGNLADILRITDPCFDPVITSGSCIQPANYCNIDIIPGDDSLMDLDLSKVELGRVNINILRQLVEGLKEVYDYILIDCPPAFNAASAAALVAADDVVIPIKLDAFSIRGMANLMRQIKNMRRINPRLRLAGCLPTMWYNDPQIQDAEQQLRNAGLPIFQHIRRSDTVDKMTFRQEALLVSSPNSGAGIDYRKFVIEYIGGVK